MSEPLNLFQSTKNAKTGNLSFLSLQVATWKKLTKLIQPILPQPEQWQIACYQQGILTITGENQAMISQLSYLQTQYIIQLSQLPEFKDLHKIKVLLRSSPQKVSSSDHVDKTMSKQTQTMLQEAAGFVTDPKLSQAMLRLASNKTK